LSSQPLAAGFLGNVIVVIIIAVIVVIRIIKA